ncbi:hypothetical protein RhiirB3_458661 [Rhizophagus irregularis]|nr:hypothetical protein RhiirB3_458661 [Rhizophagus irregularis]
MDIFSFTNLEFYTDGSLKTDDDNPRMGFGWLFTTDIDLNIEFASATDQWASSTRAEIMAVLTCLIVCPPNSSVKIFTDSLASNTTNHRRVELKGTTHKSKGTFWY